MLVRLTIILIIIIASANDCMAQMDTPKLPPVVEFNQHIRPIMSNTCFACHGPDESTNESGLRLDSFAAAIEGGAIEPGDATNSSVMQRILDTDDPMPPNHFRHQLSSHEKSLFEKWIKQGAKYETHWSYSKLTSPVLPTLQAFKNRDANPIDAFILKKLESLKIAPAPIADKRTLLRRLSLDLIGLPPTIAEVRSFVDDTSADAYEKQVDRLLASPHYGERMAARWLDIVRFSDTVGFHGDQNQRIFPYRDYVIQSLNDNQPFDEFTIEQLAGDLLPNPSQQQLIATGLIRLNMMTREGGAQPGEYLAKYSADRVRMIGTAWMGATLGCCECHDHKYDPYSIKDFYSMAAFFDDVRQWGVYNDYGYTPNPDLRGYNNDYPFPPEIRIKSKSLQQQMDFLESQLDRVAAAMVSDHELKSEEFEAWATCLTRHFAKHPSLWAPVRLNNVRVQKNEELTRLQDESILLTQKPIADQSIFVTKRFEEPTFVKSIKLQVLPDKRNGGFVGRTGGNFSASLSVSQLPISQRGDEKIKVIPRFVRIELPGEQKILSLAEVEIFGPERKINIATNSKVNQSSVAYLGSPELAIDGVIDGNYANSSVTHTKTETNPWWELDLGSEQLVDKVNIHNRTDGGLQTRLNGFRLVLLDKDRNAIYQTLPQLPRNSVTIHIPNEVPAASVMATRKIASAQADLYAAERFRNGKANAYLGKTWQSGSIRWQLPKDETRSEHNAVFHLESPMDFKAGQSMVVQVNSSDIGRFRLFTSPVDRPIVNKSAANRMLMDSLSQKTPTSTSGSNNLREHAPIRSAYYRSTVPTNQQDAKVQTLRNEIASCYSGYAMTMVAQPVKTEKYRQTRVLPRGDWKDKSGPLVLPDTPSFLPKSKQTIKSRKSRLDLAHWLISKENPLTARHYVNRTWKHFFGNGISNVLDDLGNQGEWPSHPKLLDWLASEFQSDWDRKRLTRLIVTSSTYRQQASVLKNLKNSDPHNRLLAQQSARRLEAEAVRDNALSIAGLLNTDWVGGRSVFPYQPPGYYANIQFPNRRYETQTNGLQYRRGVYMHWQRTFLHPMLTNFDAPSRDECAADRTQSNSPQQALTLLNDPVFVEAARAFALRLLQNESSNSGPTGWIRNGFQIALARDPSPAEFQPMLEFYKKQLQYFTANPKDANLFSASKQLEDAPPTDPIEVAALGQVCRVILNLHEVITRY